MLARSRHLVARERSCHAISLGLLARLRGAVVPGPVGTRGEIVIRRFLILLRASPVSVARRLIVVRRRLIHVAARLIGVRRRLITLAERQCTLTLSPGTPLLLRLERKLGRAERACGSREAPTAAVADDDSHAAPRSRTFGKAPSSSILDLELTTHDDSVGQRLRPEERLGSGPP
jgi:hypothetical protein